MVRISLSLSLSYKHLELVIDNASNIDKYIFNQNNHKINIYLSYKRKNSFDFDTI